MWKFVQADTGSEIQTATTTENETSRIVDLVWGVVRLFSFPMYPITRKFEDDIQVVRTIRTCLMSWQKLAYRLLHTFVDSEFTAFDSNYLAQMTIHDTLDETNTRNNNIQQYTHYEAHNNAVSLTGTNNTSTLGVIYPESIEEIKEALVCARTHKHRIKVVGTNHSWNSDHGQSAGAKAIVMANFTTVGVPTEEGVVIVGSGTTCKSLQTQMARLGWYLPSIPEYARMTVGGTIATNSHGCSASHLPMANHVLAMEVVYLSTDSDEPQCRWVDTSGNDVQAKAFRCHMGRLGVITQLKIQLSRLTYHRRTQSMVHVDALKQDVSLLSDPMFAIGKIEPITGVMVLDVHGKSESKGTPLTDKDELREKEENSAVNAIVVYFSDMFIVWYLVVLRIMSPWVVTVLSWILSSLPIASMAMIMKGSTVLGWTMLLATSGICMQSATFVVLMTWFVNGYNDPQHLVPAHYAQSDYFFYHGYCDHSLQTEFNFDPRYRSHFIDIWRSAALQFPGTVVPCAVRVFKNDHDHVLFSHGTTPTSDIVMSMYCPTKNTTDAEKVFTYMITELDRRRVVFSVHGGKHIPEYMRDGWIFTRNVDFKSRYSLMSGQVCKYDHYGLFSVPGHVLTDHVCLRHNNDARCKCHDTVDTIHESH
mgnify:CR=1 FL=1